MRFTSRKPCIALIALAAPAFAYAALGGSVDSVRNDQVRMKAAAKLARPGNNYTVHELQMPSGTMVREYAAPDGNVFAVTWEGPAKPDLRQLLGQYFPQYAQEPAAGPSQRRHLSVRKPGLVIESHGRMRAFSGKAYLTQSVPEGVSVEELQ
jgi:hypothetical protein